MTIHFRLFLCTSPAPPPPPADLHRSAGSAISLRVAPVPGTAARVQYPPEPGLTAGSGSHTDMGPKCRTRRDVTRRLSGLSNEVGDAIHRECCTVTRSSAGAAWSLLGSVILSPEFRISRADSIAFYTIRQPCWQQCNLLSTSLFVIYVMNGGCASSH